MDSRQPAGRSRGRARSRPQDDSTQQSGLRRPGLSSQETIRSAPSAPTAPPLQGQWVRRPGQSPMEAPQPRHDQYPPVAPRASVGRSVRAPAPAGDRGIDRAPSVDKALVPAAPGGGGDAPSGLPGRGAMRGRRVMEVVTRPPQWVHSKKGKSGIKITLKSNYFKVKSVSEQWCLYQYHVDFNPQEDRTIVKKGLLGLHRQTLGGYIFDGTSLYMSHKLPSDETELISTRTSDGEIIRVLIKFTGTLAKGDPHYLQFYNILVRKCLGNLKLQLVGRNYFDAIAKVEINQYNFELWPGYITSIRQHERDMLMCAEVTNKVMRSENMLTVMSRILQERRNDYQTACKAEVIGQTVLTDYNNNTYRIDDIDFNASPMSTFFLKKDQRNVTYKDYYKNKYNIIIKDPKQPLLVTRTSDKNRRSEESEVVYLIPELCRVTGLSDSMRSDFRLMNTMAKYTRIDARARVEKLLAFNRRLHGEPSVRNEFKQWGLELDRDLVTIEARVIGEAKIVMADRYTASPGQNADWTNEFRNHGLYETIKLDDWVMIVPERLSRDGKSFVSAMQKATRNFQIRDPRIVEIRNDSAQNYVIELEKVMSKTNPQLVLCVVFKQRGDTYSAIKKSCCMERPVPSQVVTAKCFDSKRMISVATKVAIQINCKIGGSPWTTIIPLEGLMIVGFDVCHDTNQRNRDVGATVVSLGKTYGRYFSAVSSHTNSEEISNDLAVNIVNGIRKYQEYNQSLPVRIVVYRDGVGEGQIPYVFEHEVLNVRTRVSELYGIAPDAVPMAYVIVNKRLDTRLFWENRGALNNPPPGTVVDDVITNPSKYDFFLVAQAVRQGSVSPTAFSVIYDNVSLDPDKMQVLTFRLMHMYFNWSGTVKVPAPVQLAHKLAFLVSQSLHGQPSPHLETLLWYL